MLITKVKINKVSNLSDARYFAAKGVDYLGFCCNKGTEMYCAPSKIKEIMDWVEGPKFVLEFDGWQSESDIQELITFLKPNALHFGAFATYEESFGLPIFKDVYLENNWLNNSKNIDYIVARSEKPYKQLTSQELNILDQMVQKNDCFVDLEFELEEIRGFVSKTNPIGIILRGSEEEKVGVKSFENIEEIFDLIEIEE